MKVIGLYPRVHADATGDGVVAHAGAVVLVNTLRAVGLDRALSRELARWRKPTAVHDPAKVVCDLALMLAIGGDALADIALLRAEPALFGRVASDPTVSRCIDALAADAPAALAAIDRARATARAAAWAAAGAQAPDSACTARDPLILDLDATLVTAHSDKQNAAATFKRSYGFHPLLAFVDHGAQGTGEPLAVMLRAGNAGSNTAADHIGVIKAALAQLPGHKPGTRPGRKVLIRIDGAGATHALIEWIVTRRMSYSIGFTLPETATALIEKIPPAAWTPAYDAGGNLRDGAFVAELTGLMDLSSWPPGMRVIVRKERPHPGAQLRITDADGNRITAFATNTATGGPGAQLPDLELRHRRRARAEDRIRVAKDTGLTNLPLHDFAQNQIWCALVALACELTAWMQTLALHAHDARRWEPKRLRLRLFAIPARLGHTGRRHPLRLSAHAPWTPLLLAALAALHALPG